MARRRRIRFWDMQAPRGLTKPELAHYLGMTEPTLDKKLPTMRKHGFPDKDVLLDRYDLNAVDLWLDRRSGLISPSQDIGDDGTARRLREFRSQDVGDGGARERMRKRKYGKG